MIPITRRTVHVSRDQWHSAWDQSIEPIAMIGSGETVSFDLLDASCGQIVKTSTVEAVRTLDFSRVDLWERSERGTGGKCHRHNGGASVRPALQ